MLAIGLNSGEFLVINANTLKLVVRKRDRGKSILDIRFSPCGSMLAVGSDENCVDLYDVMGTHSGQSYNKLGYCKDLKQLQSFMQVDFSADSKFLRVLFTMTKPLQSKFTYTLSLS